MIIKENYSDISDGILSHIKKDIKFKYSETSRIFDTPLEKLIGPQEYHDSCVGDQTKHPTWLEISYGNKYIIPSYYTMQGRINENHCYNQLRSWDFEGKTESGKWVKLHNETNNPFSCKQIKSFPIERKEPIKAVRINLTNSDGSDQWWICIGHIDIYGYTINKLQKTCKQRNYHTKFSFCIIWMLIS